MRIWDRRGKAAGPPQVTPKRTAELGRLTEIHVFASESMVLQDAHHGDSELHGSGHLTNVRIVGPQELVFDFVATTARGLLLIEHLKAGSGAIVVLPIPDPTVPGKYRVHLRFFWG